MKKQCREIGETGWADCDKERFDYCNMSTEHDTREVECDKCTVQDIVIRKLTDAFDEFIGECLNEDERPAQPSIRSVFKARGCLPIWCKNTIVKKK